MMLESAEQHHNSIGRSYCHQQITIMYQHWSQNNWLSLQCQLTTTTPAIDVHVCLYFLVEGKSTPDKSMNHTHQLAQFPKAMHALGLRLPEVCSRNRP